MTDEKTTGELVYETKRDVRRICEMRRAVGSGGNRGYQRSAPGRAGSTARGWGERLRELPHLSSVPRGPGAMPHEFPGI